MYLEYFGFREKPFNVTPDPRLFYNNPVYQETYAGLLYGIHERKGFISLIGEVGTGKTTLLRKLMSELREPVHFVYVCYTTLTFEELLSFICADLGLELGEKSNLQGIQALNNFLLDVSKDGGTGVLLVDEAQNLGDDVLENLRLLSNLETASEKLLQIVLVGQPELERKLAQPKLRQLKQRIAIQGRLGRLKEREVGPFMLSRLSAAGYDGDDLFTREAVQCIATYSKGTPRLINVICDNALLVAYSLNQKTVQAEIIEEVAHDLQLQADTRLSRVRELHAETEVGGWGNYAEEDVVADDSPPALAPLAASTATASPPRMRYPEVVNQSNPRLSRLIGGAVLALALLAGAGAAILPKWWGSGSNSVLTRKEEDKRVSAVSPGSPARSAESHSQEDEKGGLGVLSTPVQPGNKGNPKQEKRTEPDTGAVQRQTPPTLVTPVNSWRDHPLLVKSKMTIFDLVLKNYGNYNTLALDLIQEKNPRLKDLAKIVVGEKIWLPPLTQETLVRVQPEGGYQLILASFRNQRDAEQFAQRVRDQGYAVAITPRKIAANFVVQRVEIHALKNLDEVKAALGLVNINNVLSGRVSSKSRGATVVGATGEPQPGKGSVPSQVGASGVTGRDKK